MHHHSDSDFKHLEDTVERQETHIEHDDAQILLNKERLDKMDGIAETVSFFFGSGVLFGLATIIQKRKGSA